MSGGHADRSALTVLLHRGSKTQESTTHGRENFRRGNKDQQESTIFNRVSKSQQKSAKVSKISPGPRAQSAKISDSQQKSACFALVRKQLAVFLKPNRGYWNIKECATGGPRTSYKFLLQTNL